MTNKILTGHTSPETAYVVDDYPYGYVVRTKIRYWVETSERFGQRFMSQTLKPGTEHWNRPKASTYTSFVVLYVDDATGRIYWAGWHPYNGPEALRKFLADYVTGLSDESLARGEALVRAYTAHETKKGEAR